MQTNLSWQEAHQWLSRDAKHGAEGRMTEELEDTFGVDGYVQSLESGDGFTGVYMSKFTKLYTFNMCSLLCINYISTLKITITRVEKKEGHVGWDVLWQPSWKIQPISFTKCFQHARHCVCSCFHSTVTESPNNPTWGGDEEVANYLLLLLLFWLSLSHEVLVLGREECLGSGDQDLGAFPPEL